jgi:hypothetical protein
MCALRSRPFPFALTPEDLLFLRTVANDTEDAPWMTMNDAQWRNATALYWSLETYTQTHPVPWHPGGMLPLTYVVPGEPERKKVAPDVFVARVPVRGRSSLPVDEEGMPPFVLEVVSASSVKRDLEEKERIYRLLGVQEYVIVRLDLPERRLEGYRMGATGTWETWPADEQGCLWSGVLRLWLAVIEGEVRALTQAGELLPTQVEERVARQQAEAEVARLRAMLDHLTRGGDETPAS